MRRTSGIALQHSVRIPEILRPERIEGTAFSNLFRSSSLALPTSAGCMSGALPR